MSHADSKHGTGSADRKRRPSIPAEVVRKILIEAGHRCAVCGIPFPIERAHIIPWGKSQDHSVENLICLCANCHERADRDWDERTLREYKRMPWVSRQNIVNVLEESSRTRETVVMTLRLDPDELDDEKKRRLVSTLVDFLDTRAESVEISVIRRGSTKVFVRLDAEAAAKLLHAHATGDPGLRERFGDLVVTDIRSKTEEVIANRAYELWQAEGCPQGRDLEFWHQAEREIAEIHAEAGERLDCFISSFADLNSVLDDVRRTLARTNLTGARLSDSLIQQVLSATRDELGRITGGKLRVDLIGIGSGETKWVSVASPPGSGDMAAKVLLHELDEMLRSGKRIVGSIKVLADRGVVSAGAVPVFHEEGIRAVAVWPVHVIDDEGIEQPALVLFALASDSTAFANSLTYHILDHNASLLGLVIEIGRRERVHNRHSERRRSRED